MSVDISMDAARAASAHRLTRVDSLLPRHSPPDQAFSGPSASPSTCEARFAVSAAGSGTGREPRSGTGREPLAVGHCEHWIGAPGSLDLVWGPTRRFTLFPEIAGPDVAGPLDQLIGQWRDHLAAVPEADGEDTAAIINWPSRDIDGVNVMLQHGLTPLNVLAARRIGQSARPAQHPGPAQHPEPAHMDGLTIRRATPADLEAVTGLAAAEISYDAHFGDVIDRPYTAEAMRGYFADALATPEPWIWVAERDGTPLGLLAAEPPETARWIAPLTDLSPVAYLMSAFVEPTERGGGIGGILTREFHRAAQGASVGAALLHYELLNPRSGPFWSQQGYRPLWTTFEARPARRLR
jgi:hypothetical protein